MHFGSGGLVDYVLNEVTWIGSFNKTDFVGRHRAGEGGHQWEAPGYWWDFMTNRFGASGLKRNLVIR